MKKIVLGAMGLAALFATSCSKNVDVAAEKPLIPGATVDTLVGHITANTTLTKTTYLKGIVFVDTLVTLTVNPGITIIGSPGAVAPDLIDLSNNKGVLIVRRGGKLIANGTATQPIVWTSSKPSGSRVYGDWGGVVLMGKAPIKAASGATVNIYEAFATAIDKTPYEYGGNVASDNSGSIKYNRIEFAGGTVLAANQEVNGLTFSGVGSGTTVDFVEVSNSGDDGFEFFGGRVNAKHLLSYGNKDDDFDFDEAYLGNLQYIIAYRNDLADNSGSEFIESDNNSAGTAFPGVNFTRATIANATFIGPTSLTVRPGSGGRFDGGVYVRRNSRINLANSLIIADVLPVALGVTPTTRINIDNLPGTTDPAYIRHNLWQSSSPNAVVWDNDEGNQIIDGTATAIPDFILMDNLGNATQVNAALPNYAAFKLDAVLKPLAGSPALTGGLSLTFLDPFFTNTTQRGGVTTTDPWTSVGSWLSTAIN